MHEGKQSTYFRWRHGPHERGTLFRFRTTLYCPSGEGPLLDEVVDGGVGLILAVQKAGVSNSESRIEVYGAMV